MKRLSPAETLAEAMEHRPALRPLLEAFAPLMKLRGALPVHLAEAVVQSGFRLPDWDDARAQAGEPLLAGADLSALALPLREAALAILPVLSTMQGMEEHGPELTSFFQSEEAALRAARAGRTIYTPKLFYKFYRCLAKVLPVKLMVKFAGT